MAVGAYLIGSQTFVPKLYNVFVALAAHVWLLIFWVIDLGLVANLAAMWGRGDYCYTTYYGCKSNLSYNSVAVDCNEEMINFSIGDSFI